MKLIPLLLPLLAVGYAQDSTVQVPMVISVEGHHGQNPSKVTANDITVESEKHRVPISDMKPVLGPPGVQLWILIDEGADTTIGNQFGDLRKFIASQPATVDIAVGYMRNGTVDVRQRPTGDHDAAAKVLRLPLGQAGISASPYISLTDMIHKWPPSERPREILMITSGIDFEYGPGPDDPYLSRAIDDAQRAGVVVNSIYYGSAGHFGHSYWQINWGQNNLSQLAEATGGEFYWEGNSSPISFAPFLDELSRRMQNQYLVTLMFPPEGKPKLVPVKLRTEIHDVSVVGPARVDVPK